MTRKKIAFVPFCTYNTLLQTNEVYILVTRRPLRRPVVRKKSENIDPKHTYKNFSSKWIHLKSWNLKKMIKEIWITILSFSYAYVPFISKLVLQAVLHLTHLIIFFLWFFFSYVPIHRVATASLATYHASNYFLVLMFFLMSQFTAKLLLSAFPHIMHPNIFCS